ncbi:MAG: RIP metalloprotease RseP [Paracoccaceae bacterium]
MELISQIPLVGDALSFIIPFLVVLSVVVFVHEYGHYIVGRWCGIGAEVFSIGFGKTLVSWTDKRGTRWQIAALPLGGFVKFVGDMDPASVGQADETGMTEAERRASFHNAALWKRALTVAAGPVFNFILSILIFAALAYAQGAPTDRPIVGEVRDTAPADLGLEQGDEILTVDGVTVETWSDVQRTLRPTDGIPTPVTLRRDGDILDVMVNFQVPARIDHVEPGYPAARAGILPGDILVRIAEHRIDSFRDVETAMTEIPLNQEIDVVVSRNGEDLSFTFTPNVVTRTHPVTFEEAELATMGVRGHSAIGVAHEWIGPGTAMLAGVLQTYRVIDGTATVISDMLFQGADTSQLGGPIRIAEISGDTAERGVPQFLSLIALLSTSIGILNLLPIPVLDGGHLLFYSFEAIRGRPLNAAWMQVGTVIGLSLVLSLMVFATYNDIARLF